MLRPFILADLPPALDDTEDLGELALVPLILHLKHDFGDLLELPARSLAFTIICSSCHHGFLKGNRATLQVSVLLLLAELGGDVDKGLATRRHFIHHFLGRAFSFRRSHRRVYHGLNSFLVHGAVR